MPVLIPLAIGAAGIGSALIGSSAAKDAANIQAQSANNALSFQKQIYQDNQPRFDAATNAANTNFTPYMDAGKGATYTLSSLMGGSGGPGNTNQTPDYSSFFNSPDYKFAQQQGELGISRAANARGANLGGGVLKDLDQFNSGLATQNYGNYFNRLMGLSQLGQQAASGQAGALSNIATGAASSNNQAASTIGNTIQGVGQAQASGVVGSANAISGGLNSTVSNSLLAQYVNGRNPSAYSSSIGGFGTGSSFMGGGSPTGYGI